MKKTILAIVCAVYAILNVCCIKESPEAKGVDYVRIKLAYPADLFKEGETPVYKNCQVSLKSASREYTGFTDNSGVALFENIIPDTYIFSTSHILNDTERAGMHSPPAKGIDVIAKGILPSIRVLYDNISEEVLLGVGKTSDILISKVYFTGTKYVVSGVSKNYGAGNTAYDCYLEIYNNGEDTVSTENLYLASLDTESTNPFADRKETYVYAKDIYRIPAKKVAPGESIVIARQARNHLQADPPVPTSLDLSDADFETKGVKDPQSQGVPELPYVYHMLPTLDYLHFIIKGGFTYVLFTTPENPLNWAKVPPNPARPTTNLHIQVPVNTIIDGMDVVAYTAIPDLTKKRLPNSIDASYGMLPADSKDGYATVSLERKVLKGAGESKKTLTDVNNTGSDFVWVRDNVKPRDYSKPELYVK